MADNNNIPAYPFMFDPSQYLNKYSAYAGQTIPWGQYSGVPTDAHGNPIQSYLDAQNTAAAPAPTQAPPVSLNSVPAAAAASGPDYSTSNPAYANYLKGHPAGSQISAGGQLPSGQNYGSATPTNVPPTMMPGVYGQSQAAAAPQAAKPAGPDMNAAYLAALSNPGHVTTPGATVPQAPTPSGQSGVLQQFLANWKPTTGAGNYNNQGFYNALQGQV